MEHNTGSAREAAPVWEADQSPSHSGTWMVRALLLAVGIGLVLFLRETDSPWKKGLETLSDPEDARLKHFIVSGLWWAAVVNLVLTTLLLLTTPWWLKVRPSRRSATNAHGAQGNSLLRFWLPVVGAVVLATILGIPRLHLSLWGDEENTLRKYVMGSFERDDSGNIVEKPNSWHKTFWTYTNPNNHVLNTVLARVSLTTWRSFFWDGKGLPFSEVAIRLPGFLAALAGIAVLASLLRALGFTRAGVIAAWLCALHPWFLRYATECRGYAYMLLFLPASLLCLVSLWRNPRWSTALILGVCQFLLLYAYTGAIYILATIHVTFAIALGLRWWSARKDLQTAWARLLPTGRRWLVGSVLGAMMFLQLYGPCIPQLQRYLAGDRVQQGGTMDADWVANLGSALTFGTRWTFPDPSNTLVITLSSLVEQRPWLLGVVGLFILAVVIGFVRLVRAGGIATSFAIAIPMAIGLMFTHSQVSGTFLYLWYMIFALPLFIILMSLGIEQLGGWFIRRRWQSTGYVAPAVALLLFAILTSPQRRVIRSQPVEQQRESVRATRASLGTTRAEADSTMTFGLAKGGSHFMTVPSYDPASNYVSTVEELRELMSRADASSTPLYANIAMPALGRLVYPEIMSVLDDPQVFSLVKILQGLEDHVTRYVYRYNPGSGSSHDSAPQS